MAQVSVDLLLGRKFTVFKPKPGYLTSIQVDSSLWESADLWEHHEQDKFTLDPGGFVLAQTLVHPARPRRIRRGTQQLGACGHHDPRHGTEDRSGLQRDNHAGDGKLRQGPVELWAGVDAPAQLMLFKLSKPIPKANSTAPYRARPGRGLGPS